MNETTGGYLELEGIHISLPSNLVDRVVQIHSWKEQDASLLVSECERSLMIRNRGGSVELL